MPHRLRWCFGCLYVVNGGVCRCILCANVESHSFNGLAFFLSSEKSAIPAHEFPYKHKSVECGYAVAHNVCHKLTFCVGALWRKQSFPKVFYLFSFFLDFSLQFIFACLKVCKGVVLVVVCCHVRLGLMPLAEQGICQESD